MLQPRGLNTAKCVSSEVKLTAPVLQDCIPFKYSPLLTWSSFVVSVSRGSYLWLHLLSLSIHAGCLFHQWPITLYSYICEDCLHSVRLSFNAKVKSECYGAEHWENNINIKHNKDDIRMEHWWLSWVATIVSTFITYLVKVFRIFFNHSWTLENCLTFIQWRMNVSLS